MSAPATVVVAVAALLLLLGLLAVGVVIGPTRISRNHSPRKGETS